MGLGMGMGWRGGGDRARVPKNFRQALKRCIPWAKPHLPIMSFGLAATLLGAFIGQQYPRITQHIIDDVIGTGQYQKLGGAIGLYVVLLVFGQFIGSFSGYLMNVAGQRLLHRLRMELYDKYQALSLSYFDDKRVGDLLSRATGDINHLEGLIINTANNVIRQVFGMGFALYFMCTYNWKLAMLILALVPLLAVGMVFYSRKVRPMYRAIRDRFGELSAKLAENLSGIRVIKAFNREASEHAQVEEASQNLVKMNLRATMFSTFFYPSISLTQSMGTVLVLAVGANMALHNPGEFKVGMIMAFLMYVSNFYSPINEFIRTYDSIQRALASGERVFEVLDEPLQVQDPAEPVPLERMRGEVELRDVAFRYATGEEVLRGVSVHVQPGQRIALVGHSGAGKTSFINLIPRFYDVTDGEVLIDGIDVRAFKQTELRKHIALVLQETFLFNGTVQENLRFGKLEATDDTVVAAAKAANAHEFIERFPDGYATQIGERGIKLSGGQKQRLAIARAVLADPRILILDEATSSVDSESEFLIHQALLRLMEGRTTFIIAHRLSTIRSADVILVLENGRIVESGDHDTLYEADGAYAQMYRQQFWLDDLAENGEANITS
ncbi:MAG: ABC transporter ATP-binding protein [Armatimonadota bacterium]